MKHLISTFLFLGILSFDISAQNIPKNSNAYDLDSNKTGIWTILYDSDWNITDIIDSIAFYRIITYEKGIPVGKVFDYYLTGKKQWEGYLLSDYPDDIYDDGEMIYYNTNGIIEYRDITINNENSRYYYADGKLVFDIHERNNLIISYTIYEKDLSVLSEDVLHELVDVYRRKELFSDAVLVNNEILNRMEEYYGLKSEEYVTALSNEAYLNEVRGDYQASLEIINKVIEIERDIYVVTDTNHLLSLAKKAKYLNRLADYNDALKIINNVISIGEQVFDIYSPTFSVILSIKTIILNDMGYYEESLLLNQELLERDRDIFGENHMEYITILHNLSFCYTNLEKYSNAIATLNEVMLLIKNNYGINNTGYSDALTNLADIYSQLGDYQNAIKFNNEALEIEKLILGDRHPDYLITLHNKVIYLMEAGDYEESLNIITQLNKTTKEVLGETHPNYLTGLHTLASCYANMDQFDIALKMMDTVLNIEREILGELHPSYLLSLSNYSSYLEDPLESIKINNKLLSIYSENKGDDYARTLYQQSINYLLVGEYDRSCELFTEYFDFNKSLYKRYEQQLNHSLRKSMYNEMIDEFNYQFNICNNQIVNYSYWILLKGRDLSSINNLSSIIYNSQDTTLISHYEDWMIINKKIGFYYEKDNINNFDIDYLEYKKDSLEFHLTNKSTYFTENQRDYSFEDIQNNLSDNEVYIDLINVFDFDFDDKYYSSDPIYYAYITKKGDESPLLINLGSSSYFDSIYNYYSTYTQKRPSYKEFRDGDEENGNICYQNFWSELEPYLEGVSTVYFSPEGVYSKINLNVLYDSTSSSFLMDKYDIVYVSNVEDFVHQKENIQLYDRPDDLHAVLIGNPTFLLGEDELVLATNESKIRAINQDELDSLQRGYILSQLNETQVEIDLISNNLKSKGWDVELISGIDATETKVKTIEAPKILHIATHGFFFEDQEMVKRSNMISTDNKKAVANPMTRSGLIFSGAENTMNEEILADDNGWLNSYEASLLNLRGTELVVLSACETGTGDVQNGKGVYGLQRAIRVAGAESLIMSMWEVDDKATQELMTYFYDYWIDKNMTKKEAFNQAQEKIREKYKHPYYWGAFIMLGE